VPAGTEQVATSFTSATPLPPAQLTVPPPMAMQPGIAVPPALNETVPVGLAGFDVPGPVTATAAVKVTGWPATTELLSELRVADDAAGFTVSMSELPEAPPKVPSPE
jgi:hypothetical protein